MTLEDEEQPIDEEIADELIPTVPEHWRSVVLEVAYSKESEKTEGFAHRIRSPEGHRELIEPTPLIYDATLRLYDLFQSAGKAWKRVQYRVDQDAHGEWDYCVKFEY